PRVDAVRESERRRGLDRLETYLGFQSAIDRVKYDLMEFLLRAKREGKRVLAYGAPAKGNTLLNYCGVRRDLLEFTADRSPHKQGRYLPGSRIPIRSPEALLAAAPDYILILPWNIKAEILEQLSALKGRTKFVVPIPRL